MGMSVDCSLEITDDFAMCDVANSRCFLTKVNLKFGLFSSLLFNSLTVYIFACTEPCSSIENCLYKIPCFPSVPLVSRINFPSCGFILSHEQPIRIWMQPHIYSNSCLVLFTSLPVNFPKLDFQTFPSLMN